MSDSIDGKRHTIALTFGYGHVDWNEREFFLEHLAQSVSESFGGFRFTTGTGFWRADGNGNAPHTGELFEEDTVTLHVTVTGDVASAVSILQAAAVEAKQKTTGDVPMEWVNVEVTQSEAHHFKM
jgi:hypothetical protein